MPRIGKRTKPDPLAAVTAAWDAFENRADWKRSKKGNLWRLWDGMTLVIFAGFVPQLPVAGSLGMAAVLALALAAGSAAVGVGFAGAGAAILDEGTHSLLGPASQIRLSRTEWRLVRLLMGNRGRVISHAEILREVWGVAYAGSTHLVHDAICRLRHRFEAAGLDNGLIKSVHGIGYTLTGAHFLLALAYTASFATHRLVTWLGS